MCTRKMRWEADFVLTCHVCKWEEEDSVGTREEEDSVGTREEEGYTQNAQEGRQRAALPY